MHSSFLPSVCPFHKFSVWNMYLWTKNSYSILRFPLTVKEGCLLNWLLFSRGGSNPVTYIYLQKNFCRSVITPSVFLLLASAYFLWFFWCNILHRLFLVTELTWISLLFISETNWWFIFSIGGFSQTQLYDFVSLGFEFGRQIKYSCLMGIQLCN